MEGGNAGRQVDRSRYNIMLHYGYNTTCTHNIGGEVQYGYKSRSRARDIHITDLTLEGLGEKMLDRSTGQRK